MNRAATTLDVAARATTSGLLALVLAGVVAAAAAQVPAGTDAYEVPGEDTFPEGIAHDADAGVIYVTGAGSGAIHRIDLQTGEAVELMAPGRARFTTIGLATDPVGALWVAGGSAGEILRFDAPADATDPMEPDATLTVPGGEGTFVNDLVVAPNGDLFATDSGRPVLYRVPAGSDEAEAWLDLEGTAFTYVEGFNANGIEVTEDGAYLIVVNAATGRLYRIEIATQAVDEIEIAGEPLQGGDGLVLDGRTLYVVQNGPDQVSVVELADDLLSGDVVEVIEDERFASAATAALVGNDLLVVNAQFAAMQTGPELPFTVSVVRGVR